MNVIKEALESIEVCDKCGKEYNFEQRQFPMVFHKCRICKRNLCPNCWGHKHLLAWKYCSGCKPSADENQSHMDFDVQSVSSPVGTNKE